VLEVAIPIQIDSPKNEKEVSEQQGKQEDNLSKHSEIKDLQDREELTILKIKTKITMSLQKIYKKN
jgi:hypothetical protein